MQIPTAGWLAYCKGPEGNIFGVMRPDPSAKQVSTRIVFFGPATPAGTFASRSLLAVMIRPRDVMNRFLVVAADVTSRQDPSFIEVDLKHSPFQ